MGIVLRFRRKKNHARASSRAAKRVSKSAVTPAAEAFSVAKIEDQYSGGTQLRCHHLATVPALTPTSDAKAIREPCASFGPQSSTTSRNDVIVDMAAFLGQSVLKCKPNPSLDVEKPLGHNVRMADTDQEAEYKQGFMKRVAEARVARGWKQWQMAEALDIPQDQYKQYETRGMMPHRYLWSFCMLANVSFEWLMTGKGRRAVPEPPRVEPDIQPKLKKARRSKPAAKRVA